MPCPKRWVGVVPWRRRNLTFLPSIFLLLACKVKPSIISSPYRLLIKPETEIKIKLISLLPSPFLTELSFPTHPPNRGFTSLRFLFSPFIPLSKERGIKGVRLINTLA
jgi:hypothetical protein